MATRLASVRRWLEPVALGVALWGLLLFNAVPRRALSDLTKPNLPRRFWEDLTVATVNYQRGTDSVYCGRAWDPWSERIAAELKATLPETAQRLDLRSWQFWRTLPCRDFADAGPMRLRDSDDPGRAWLTARGFRLLGGVAFYLPLWLAVFTALPLFVWLSVECRLAGCSWVAGVTLGCFVLSTYAAELLTLPYSAVGFHLLGLLLVITLAVSSLLHPRPTWSGLTLRWLLAGVFFAVCTLCRGTGHSFLPALTLLALATAARTAGASSRGLWRIAGGVALAMGLLLGPYWVVRPAQRHETWFALWEGVGDFDREKGHAWYDPVARDVLRREGFVIPDRAGPICTPAMEATMRRLLVRDITSDPLWYAKILVQRVPATLLQLRLWPRASVDRTSFTPSTHPDRDASDIYYGLAKTADWFGLGPSTWEAPLPLLWLPLIAVLGGAVAERMARRRDRLFPNSRLAALAAVALAAGAMPLLFTTAAAPEMQAFVLVYFFAAGLTADALQRAVRGMRT